MEGWRLEVQESWGGQRRMKDREKSKQLSLIHTFKPSPSSILMDIDCIAIDTIARMDRVSCRQTSADLSVSPVLCSKWLHHVWDDRQLWTDFQPRISRKAVHNSTLLVSTSLAPKVVINALLFSIIPVDAHWALLSGMFSGFIPRSREITDFQIQMQTLIGYQMYVVFSGSGKNPAVLCKNDLKADYINMRFQLSSEKGWVKVKCTMNWGVFPK